MSLHWFITLLIMFPNVFQNLLVSGSLVGWTSGVKLAAGRERERERVRRRGARCERMWTSVYQHNMRKWLLINWVFYILHCHVISLLCDGYVRLRATVVKFILFSPCYNYIGTSYVITICWSYEKTIKVMVLIIITSCYYYKHSSTLPVTMYNVSGVSLPRNQDSVTILHC